MNIVEHRDCYASEYQRELLKLIFKSPFSPNIYLTGGACLSIFYLNHRKDKDIDIVFSKGADLLKYATVFRKFATESIVESSKNIKLNFIYKRSKLLNKLNILKIDDVPVRIDSMENIAINKIRAIATREAVRDLFDIGILFDKYFTVDDFIKFYKIAMKQEDNLKDFLYIYEVLQNATNTIKNNKEELFLKEGSNFDQVLEKMNKTFEKLSESLIKINYNSYKNINKLKYKL